MFCTHCGHEATADAVYCSLCGHQTNPGNSSQSAPKRLYRLSYDKKLAGICSGFARYLNIDVTLVRILTIAIVCLTGFVPGGSHPASGVLLRSA